MYDKIDSYTKRKGGVLIRQFMFLDVVLNVNYTFLTVRFEIVLLNIRCLIEGIIAKVPAFADNRNSIIRAIFIARFLDFAAS